MEVEAALETSSATRATRSRKVHLLPVQLLVSASQNHSSGKARSPQVAVALATCSRHLRPKNVSFNSTRRW